MTLRSRLTLVAALGVVIVVALTYASGAPGEPWSGPLRVAAALVTVATGLAVNTIAGRHRAKQREDAPDSVEAQAHLHARAGAFTDALVLAAALAVAVTMPSPLDAWAWVMVYLCALVVAFWVRDWVELRRWRG